MSDTMASCACGVQHHGGAHAAGVDPEVKRSVLTRLRRIEGQMRGLQKMVEDLLDFNSFAVGEITVNKEMLGLNELVQEICYQWSIVQEEGTKLTTHLPNEPILFDSDPVRIQQILINLLNNAKQAMGENGEIDVTVYKRDGKVSIDVHDNGSGIPINEQDLIFERFFRGEDKKHKVRGSRIVAMSFCEPRS